MSFNDAMNPILWVTIVIAGCTLWQARIYASMRKHTKVIERAYVKLSHEWPCGAKSPLAFNVSEGEPPGGELWFSITAKNEGHTPAVILGGGLWARVLESESPPPETPKHYPFKIAPVFLTGGGGDFVRDRSMLFFPATSVPHFRDGHDTVGEQLWLIGHVDYRDCFGDCHRAGYCRHFNNASKDLVFDQTTSGLNYDRRLRWHERRKYRGRHRVLA